MSTIIIAGAGKSSSYLIRSLIDTAERKHGKWKIIVADSDIDNIKPKIRGSAYASALVLDITDTESRQALVKSADIVVSLMPPHLHVLLAKDCLQFKKNLITSSYVSDEMREMHQAAKEAGLMFMCEMGLDPGIDHMTASHLFYSIKKVAASVTSFKSYCGGLIAPESDNNPWHYKFSWNPRNIITAGQSGAHYLHNNNEIHVPYENLFANCKKVNIDGSNWAYYANRDSLSYIDLYELPEVSTFIRATLRHPDFCKGWNMLVNLGLTNMTDAIDTGNMTYLSWLKKVSGYQATHSLTQHIFRKTNVVETKKLTDMLHWLGIFDEKPINKGLVCSGEILLGLLQERWEMQPEDKDMIIMQHDVEYESRFSKTNIITTMIVKGENREYSAMAKTVGMPMAILTELVLSKTIKPPHGVLIPTMPEIYRPVLSRLEKHGIVFTENVIDWVD